MEEARQAAGDKDVDLMGTNIVELDLVRVIDAPGVTHLTYRVVR